MATTYLTRPNRPPGPDYCTVFPTCKGPNNLQPEALRRLVDRHGHNIRDWEIHHGGRVTPPLLLSVVAPGATGGEVFLPTSAWCDFDKRSCWFLQQVGAFAAAHGGRMCVAIAAPTTAVLFRVFNVYVPPPAPLQLSDTDSNLDTDEEEGETGNMTGM